MSKGIKKQLKQEASKSPEKYFPVSEFEKYGFKRYKCENCSMMFWSKVPRKICGDTNCNLKYDFIGNTPAKQKFEFVDVYKNFKDFFEKRDYPAVKRFPVVARWREDLDFNIASIIGFQPFITKGIVEPPHELLTIPQNCIRFEDVDNVGYTGRHYTSFTMIGQCAFKIPQKYDQAKYFRDLLDWFLEEVKIPIDDIQIHEDAWVGGGDCGPSIEFFSKGLELANQVYMWFDMSEAESVKDLKPLNLKVLDMGMGQERICWFSKGSLNSYEDCMPKVCNYLYKQTGLKPNWEIYKKFLPFAGLLNLDECDDIDVTWEDISKRVGVDVEELKNVVEPVAGIYSIADHTRTLLYAFTDGALPSNVKGGYNLRLILRRALEFINKFNWNIDLFEVMKIHIEELKEQYSDLGEKNLNQIKEILDLEVEKYKEHKEKVKIKIKEIVKKDKIENKDFIQYYISDGITPDEIKKEFENQGKKIEIPSNFFTLVSQAYENTKAQKNKKQTIFEEYVKDLPQTKMIYYDDLNLYEFEDAKILKTFSIKDKDYIVLDKTIFYPELGGQVFDTGFIDDKKVEKVFKVGTVIVHQIKSN